MDLSCLVSTIQVSGVMGGVYFLAHLVANEHHLKVATYPSIVANRVQPFMLASFDGYYQQDNTCHKNINVLYSQKNSIQYSTFGMCWKRRFAANKHATSA